MRFTANPKVKCGMRECYTCATQIKRTSAVLLVGFLCERPHDILLRGFCFCSNACQNFFLALIQKLSPKQHLKNSNTNPGQDIRDVIDGTELFIQTLYDLNAQYFTYSDYKHHNTVKYLVGISPAGFITFVSCAYPGRISDPELVKACGYLNCLEPGDYVMADKGFLIRELLNIQLCDLIIPPKKRTNMSFNHEESLDTRKVARKKDAKYRPRYCDPTGLSLVELLLSTGLAEPPPQFGETVPPPIQDDSWMKLNSDTNKSSIIKVPNQWLEKRFTDSKRKDGSSKTLETAFKALLSFHYIPGFAQSRNGNIVWLRGQIYPSMRKDIYGVYVCVEVDDNSTLSRSSKWFANARIKIRFSAITVVQFSWQFVHSIMNSQNHFLAPRETRLGAVQDSGKT